MGVEWPLGAQRAIEMGENSGCVLKMGVKNTARGTGAGVTGICGAMWGKGKGKRQPTESEKGGNVTKKH